MEDVLGLELDVAYARPAHLRARLGAEGQAQLVLETRADAVLVDRLDLGLAPRPLRTVGGAQDELGLGEGLAGLEKPAEVQVAGRVAIRVPAEGPEEGDHRRDLLVRVGLAVGGHDGGEPSGGAALLHDGLPELRGLGGGLALRELHGPDGVLPLGVAPSVLAVAGGAGGRVHFPSLGDLRGVGGGPASGQENQGQHGWSGPRETA